LDLCAALLDASHWLEHSGWLMRALVTGGASLLLSLICLGCASGRGTAAVPATAVLPGCPSEVVRRVTQLYSWYLRSGGAYRDRIQEQELLFEPALYADLQAAFRLEPSERGFLDFDPFNGVQTGSYGFRLERCRSVGSDQLVVHLLVKAGLAPTRASEMPIDLWLRRDGVQWSIADFEYNLVPSGQPYKLRPFLQSLLGKSGAGSHRSSGQVLLTPAFRIVVERHCPEGSVICDRVSYLGEDRQTGSSIRLMGSTSHSICADGVTPCRFLGYRFQNGNTTYLVDEDGSLRVLQGDKLLLEEQGEWMN
jgi:hypothetical protein